jgi:ribosomal protein S7
LSSCLAKIGRTFYVDPFSQEIKIISNSDISKINSNLNSKYSDGINIEGATQKSITKSISDIDAKHIMLKGVFEEKQTDSNSSPTSSFDPPSLRSTFYKFEDLDKITSFSREDLRFFAYIAPFSSFLSGNTDLLLNSYVLGLKLIYGFENSEIYGSEEARIENFTEKGKKEEWETVIKNEFSKAENPFLGSFYDFNKTEGAYELVRKDPSAYTNLDISAVSPDETDLLQISTAYANVRLGLWFSRPSTLERIRDRSYQSIAGASFGKDIGSLQSLNISIAALSDPISTVDSLSDLSRLVLFSGKNPSKIRVGDIIPETGFGGATHVAIAKRSLFPEINDIAPNDFKLPLLENSLPAILGKKENAYFLITDKFKSVMKNLSKKAIETLSKEVENRTPSQIIVSYIKVENKEEKSYDGPDPPENDISLDQKSISLQKSKVKNFSSRSINVTEENVFQIEVLKNNIQNIMPEFNGPSINVSVDYFRPPKKEDLNVEDGVNSLSVSISPDGITTSVSYSSIRYKEIDFNLLSETYGYKQGLIIDKPQSLPAFKRK